MARLFVIPARDEPIAVILRRGPSDWYHLIQWDTHRDRFEHGAWIKGRIYGEKCDVSPDGRLFVYFLHQGNRVGTEFSDAWTAVSRVPWLYALTLWPQATTYGGGGRFIDNRSLALRAVLNPPLADFPLRGIRLVAGDAPVQESTGALPGADWCGLDHRSQLVFSRGGQLFRQQQGEDQLLADFTDLRPDPRPAPDWARRPL